MKTTLEVSNYALTPSGTGQESFKIKDAVTPGYYFLTFWEQDNTHSRVEIKIDKMTLRLVGEEIRLLK